MSHFTISGDRKTVFLTSISRICLDPAAVRTGRGDSHMKQTGMLVGNFEFNP